MDTIEELAKDLVGVSEIANRAGVQANTVAVWTQRHDNFPDPIVQIGGRVRVWWWPDVEEWITTGRKKEKRTPTKAGPRLRFHILKRDGFRCRYCGRNSTDVELQVDHLNPVSNGGDADPDNLITACVDCNAGKSDVLLDEPPPGPREEP